jgi:cell division cycle 14
MVVMRWSVADVLHPISCLELQPYRDAGYSRSDYHLHPQQILYGLSRALSHQLLDLSTFDLVSYEKAEKVEEGDWNWITPGFLAFASPVEAGWNTSTSNEGTSTTSGSGSGKLTRSFRNVLEEFETKNVKLVVRLNKKLYDRNHFLERGIDHVEMYFDDGTNPSMEMCREFINLSDRIISSGGAVAVHCKAGLGRTGTLIGAYLIYKHGFTADEAIGFMRLMRPGSCVGPQQHFLYENQLEWVKWSAQDELKLELRLQHQQQTQQVQAEEEGRSCSPRPITPPNETELREQARQRSSTPHQYSVNNPPITPRRQVVPGQPRKTPGKSRHGISAPEEKDKDSPENTTTTILIPIPRGTEDDEEMKEILRQENEMEGGINLSSSPNKNKRNSLTGTRRSSPRKSLQLVEDDDNNNRAEEEVEEEEEEDPLTMLPSSPKKSTTTLLTTSTRPSRIARSAVGNLNTTITRPLPSTSTSTAIGRSRGAKNLNTVFEAVDNKDSSSSTNNSRSRYPLRNVSGRTTPGVGTTTTADSTIPGGGGVIAPNSPSKLPTRIPAKRGATNNVTPSSPVASSTRTTGGGGGGFNPSLNGGKNQDGTSTTSSSSNGLKNFANGLAKLGGTGGNANKGRNVRRRRSSMGSQDFVQAG